MAPCISAGRKFRDAIGVFEKAEGRPLQIVGTINAYTAIMASQTVIKRFISQVAVLLMPHLVCLTLV